MLVAEHVAALHLEGDRLAVAAVTAGFLAPIPSCPGWTVTDLVGHLGMVHRWATQFVANGITTPAEPPPEAMAPPSDGDALMAWFGEGHRRLVAALETAPDDLDCWSFLDAPSPLAFWARRQSHETAIHRVDAELASGDPTPAEPDFAADGIDEMLGGFMSGRRSGRLRADPAHSLGIHAVDAGQHWRLDIGPEGTAFDRRSDATDCLLTGRASDLYYLLWNRVGPEAVTVTGDPEVLAYWREHAAIRWR